MSNLPWIPWHKVVQLRDDLRSGDLSLAIFAADLYDVIMGKAKPVYQDAKEFFALTYPTFNIRELVKDVIVRLKGQNEKAIRQLELTYYYVWFGDSVAFFACEIFPGTLFRI